MHYYLYIYLKTLNNSFLPILSLYRNEPADITYEHWNVTLFEVLKVFQALC